MTDLQRNTLCKLIGVERSLEGSNFTINKVIPGDGLVTLHCTDHNRNLNDDEIDDFIDSLGEPAKNTLATVNNAAAAQQMPVQRYMPTAENAEVKTILMETIRGIKSGEMQPQQGKAIFEGVHALVAVQKTELEMMRMTSKRGY